MNKLKVVFLGTPQIACHALEKLNEMDDIEICCVVTQPDKPAGRGHKLTPPPIKILAENLNLEVFQPTSIRKDEILLEKIKSIAPDFLITIAFGQILSQEVLDIPKYGTINLHASLLPEYRGANPIARAIADGKKVTGISTMLTSLGVDEGDVVLTQEIEITDNMTTQELSEKISYIAPDILHKSLCGLVNNEITPIKQDSTKATFAPKFTKEETFLDFNKTAQELHNIVRAMNPKPCANAHYNDLLVKIIATEVINENSNLEHGSIIKTNKLGIFVSTGEKILLIKTLKPEGKKEMNAQAWACGLKSLGKFE